ncbi:hypothetical protein OV208_18435 [Corallococcus sp. bb12-1]|uniref:hypothetical protein n=1 Tax=Corallococcus sp. bb12-1 TaxID=2996784 RepID=UPI00226EF9C4|nr:hypothetical protein [Corallococcus sp. bb12-1]MCY1043301.1 hypothetical protein [Corallococcus sp. bb12-1]
MSAHPTVIKQALGLMTSGAGRGRREEAKAAALAAVDALEHERDAARALVARLASVLTCSECGRRATCISEHTGFTSCDTCCRHDGAVARCERFGIPPATPQVTTAHPRPHACPHGYVCDVCDGGAP